MYNVQTNAGEVLENGTYEEFTEAREFAQAITAEQAIELQVVHETGVVAFVTTPVPVGEYFKPWERIENPKFPAPAFAGWVPAYTRKRIQATAYRSVDKQGWLIHDGRTGGTRVVPNTTEGRFLFTAMRLGEML